MTLVLVIVAVVAAGLAVLYAIEVSYSRWLRRELESQDERLATAHAGWLEAVDGWDEAIDEWGKANKKWFEFCEPMARELDWRRGAHRWRTRFTLPYDWADWSDEHSDPIGDLQRSIEQAEARKRHPAIRLLHEDEGPA